LAGRYTAAEGETIDFWEFEAMPEDRYGAPVPMRLALLALAAAIGVGTIALCQTVVYLITGDDPQIMNGLTFLAIQVAFVSFPFAILAIIGIRKKTPWLSGLALTAVVWGYFLFDVISSRGSGEGANIGLGLIMMGSPGIIAVICLIVAREAERSMPE
jgi:hypothetical protein